MNRRGFLPPWSLWTWLLAVAYASLFVAGLSVGPHSAAWFGRIFLALLVAHVLLGLSVLVDQRGTSAKVFWLFWTFSPVVVMALIIAIFPGFLGILISSQANP